MRPGYKQSEVGLIPEDWEVKRLGELASVTAGGTPSRTNVRYWNGDIPWITTSQVDFYTIDHAEQFITKKGLDNSAAKLLPSGTLLMALYGQGKTRGKIGVLGIEASTNQACAAISLGRAVCRDFIFYSLASQYETIRNLSNTGNQENLNGAIVRSISIVLPAETEQRAIAGALSDVDALVGALDRLGVTVERFFVQRMKTKWGSCNPRVASIRLNSELAKKPRECLEYIVVHEMVHLLEPTHNQGFVALMDRFMPKWQFHRDTLNRLPVRHERWGY